MRWEQGGERPSSWQRDDPRYRVFVYEGPDLETSTTDVLDASVQQALDAAHTLSHYDEHLWSLALVDRAECGEDGLVWLSGMDYHQQPQTQAQWRRRGQMQSRVLSARSRAGRPVVLPNGLRVIRMFPEWVRGWPLWESFSDAYRLTALDLDLSSALGEALDAWNETWSDRSVDDPLPDEEAWVAEGLLLHAAVQAELDGVAEVRREFGP